jgi:glycosyltransferase involved in cell wall biosynthesis
VLASHAAELSVKVLPGYALRRPPFDDLHWNDVRPLLRGYDLWVLGGWAEPSYLWLWTLAQVSRRRTAFWLESTRADLGRNIVKELFKERMVRGAAGVVAAGTRAAEYARALGAPRDKIFRAPNAADTEYFRAQAAALVPRREALRAELGLKHTTVLFVGRMVEAFKNVSVLLRAQRLLQMRSTRVELVLVGEGPAQAMYAEQVRAENIECVRFVNFLEHDALCRYYAAADVFVLPSRSEPWGFVLNEAMEFSLPVVVSRTVGAAADLVQPDENGLVLDPDHAEAWADALQALTCDPERRAAMGAASKRRIAPFTPDAWADGFAEAIARMTA